MSTATLSHTVSHNSHEHTEPTGWKKYLWSMDHKVIGLQYLFTSLLFLFVGGGLALLLRWQLAYPSTQVMPNGDVGNPISLAFINPQFYNSLFTMHATVMVFLVVMPLLIGAFGNYLIPLKIGAGDMAFPLINELSYWAYAFSGVILMASFLVAGGAPAGGWTSYAPLSSVVAYNNTQMGQSLWCVGIFINGLASIMGAFNYITTIVNMRAPGMGFFRMPLAVWALFITAFLLLLAVPVLSAAAAMLFLDLNSGTNLFNPAHGVQPLLWQHLFWFLAHPEVYVLILPGIGIIAEVVANNTRKPVYGYKAMVGAGLRLPITGTVLFTVANADKEEALPIAREFAAMGYALQATSGTAAYFAANDLHVETVAKITESADNLVTRIHSGQVGLVINTLSKDKRIEEEGQLIRRATVERSVPCMTSLDTAAALLLALKARAEGTFGVMTVDEYLTTK
jgi:cytochrome c oxidase subunit 1